MSKLVSNVFFLVGLTVIAVLLYFLCFNMNEPASVVRVIGDGAEAPIYAQYDRNANTGSAGNADVNNELALISSSYEVYC